MTIRTRFMPFTFTVQAPEEGDTGGSGGGGFFSGLFGGGGSRSPVASTPVPSTPVATPPADTKPAQVDPATLDGFAQLLVNSGQGKEPTSSGDDFDLGKLAGNADAFMQLAAKRDFTTGLSRETKEGLEKGEIGAIMDAIQTAARTAYASALQHATQLTDRATQSSVPRILDQTRATLEESLRQRDLKASVPAEAHPATGMVLESVAQGLMSRRPDMSPAQAMQAARSLLVDMAGSITPKTASDNRAANKSWDEWVKS